jgi:hypothetical protein
MLGLVVLLANVMMLTALAPTLKAIALEEEVCLRENCKCSGSGAGAQCTENWIDPSAAGCSKQSDCTGSGI